MRRVLAVVLLLSIILLTASACDTGSPNLTVNNPALLEVPGLQWGMTPDEVKETLNLSKRQIHMDTMVEPSKFGDTSKTNDRWVIVADDLEFFDRKILGVYCTFYRYAGNEYGLGAVELYFPDNTDIDVLLTELVDIYGESDDHRGIYTINTEGMLDYMDTTEEVQSYYWKWWKSKAGIKDIFTDAEQRAILDHYTDVFPQATSATVIEYINSFTLVELRSQIKGERTFNTEKVEFQNSYASNKNLVFNGATLVKLMQEFSK